MDFKNPDFLYATVDVAIWSDIEQGLAITAGSLATLRPLFRLVSSHFGLTSNGTPSAQSKPSNMRTPKWNGDPNNDSGKKPDLLSLTNSLFRSEKGTMRDSEDEYGMGDLQPMRLRDELVRETTNEKSDEGFNAWRIQTGKISDEEHGAGTITKQTQVQYQSEFR